MKSRLTCYPRAGQFCLDAAGRHGGGYQGRRIGDTPEAAAVQIAAELARYADGNPEGATLTAPRDVLDALDALRRDYPSGEGFRVMPSGDRQPAPGADNPSGEQIDAMPSGELVRRSIHFEPRTLAALGLAPGRASETGASWSGRVREVVDEWDEARQVAGYGAGDTCALASALARYRAILADACPALALAEWMLLADITNGSVRTCEPGAAEIDPARWLGDSVRDAEPDGVAEKWSVDLPDLAARLDALPYAGLVAVLEAVTRWWAMRGEVAADDAEVWRKAGARMPSGEQKPEYPSGEGENA